jgi:hypothetical protein
MHVDVFNTFNYIELWFDDLWALEYVYGNVKLVMFLDDFKWVEIYVFMTYLKRDREAYEVIWCIRVW